MNIKTFRIMAIDKNTCAATIDWGEQISTIDLSYEVLYGEHTTEDELKNLIESLRPPEASPAVINSAVGDLLKRHKVVFTDTPMIDMDTREVTDVSLNPQTDPVVGAFTGASTANQTDVKEF